MIKILRIFFRWRFRVRRTISEPQRKVWELLTNTKYWPMWGPSIQSVAPRDTKIILGTKGSVKTVFGFHVSFVITKFEEQNVWDWDTCGLPVTGHTIRSISPHSTEVIFDLPVLLAPYALFCWMALHKINHQASIIDMK
jgi:uncharacterized protein YndB with AHSA1/START domain